MATVTKGMLLDIKLHVDVLKIIHFSIYLYKHYA
jgi:hypothetical protein